MMSPEEVILAAAVRRFWWKDILSSTCIFDARRKALLAQERHGLEPGGIIAVGRADSDHAHVHRLGLGSGARAGRRSRFSSRKCTEQEMQGS